GGGEGPWDPSNSARGRFADSSNGMARTGSDLSQLPSRPPTLDFSPPPAAARLPIAVRRAVDAYVARFAPLVQMELEEERRQVEERLRVWPMGRLRSEGLVLTDVRAVRRGSYLGKAIVRLTAADGGELPFHRFTSGTLVTLCRVNPLSERTTEGLVLDRGRWEVRLVMDSLPPGLTEGLWRLDKGVNIVTYQRMAQAMQALYKDPLSAGAAAARTDTGDYVGVNDDDEEEGGDDEDMAEYGGPSGQEHRYGQGHGGGNTGSQFGNRRGRGRNNRRDGKRRRQRRQQDEEDEDELPP
ncbi:hypothetical protein Vafri_19510, partial [Volvox africanus]